MLFELSVDKIISAFANGRSSLSSKGGMAILEKIVDWRVPGRQVRMFWVGFQPEIQTQSIDIWRNGIQNSTTFLKKELHQRSGLSRQFAIGWGYKHHLGWTVTYNIFRDSLCANK